jgi:hypothetical protein
MSVLVFAVAAFFAAMGVAALVRPERIVAYVGTTSQTLDGRNEVRAVYGGFGIAIAAVLLAAPAAFQPGVLLCTAVALFGMAAGRVFSRLVDGDAGFYPWLFFCTEIGLGSALVAALLAR